MNKIILTLSFIIASVSFAKEECGIFDYQCHGESISKSAGIEALKHPTNSEKYEVRLWVQGSTIEMIYGYIAYINNDEPRLSFYQNELGSNQPKLKKDISFNSMRSKIEGTGIFQILSSKNENSIVCSVKDGVGYLVEAVHDGKYEGVEASNPQACYVKGAKEVMNLRKLFESKLMGSE